MFKFFMNFCQITHHINKTISYRILFLVHFSSFLEGVFVCVCCDKWQKSHSHVRSCMWRVRIHEPRAWSVRIWRSWPTSLTHIWVLGSGYASEPHLTQPPYHIHGGQCLCVMRLFLIDVFVWWEMTRGHHGRKSWHVIMITASYPVIKPFTCC